MKEPIYHFDQGKRWVVCGIKSRHLSTAANREDATCRRCLWIMETRAAKKNRLRKRPVGTLPEG